MKVRVKSRIAALLATGCACAGLAGEAITEHVEKWELMLVAGAVAVLGVITEILTAGEGGHG